MPLFRTLLDFISPRSCVCCGKRLAVSEEEVCAVCNWNLPRTHYIESPYDNAVARLFYGRFPIERAAAYMFYVPRSETGRLFYDMKYHGRKDVAWWFGHILASEYRSSGFFDDIDAIVPIPISWHRRCQRGYNQTEAIADGMSSVLHLPVVCGVLKRRRFNYSQTRLSALERQENVEESFYIKPKKRLEGKHILLIDDVVTTGSTMAECGRLLATMPGVKVSVLAVGYTMA